MYSSVSMMDTHAIHVSMMHTHGYPWISIMDTWMNTGTPFYFSHADGYTWIYPCTSLLGTGEPESHSRPARVLLFGPWATSMAWPTPPSQPRSLVLLAGRWQELEVFHWNGVVISELHGLGLLPPATTTTNTSYNRLLIIIVTVIIVLTVIQVRLT